MHEGALYSYVCLCVTYFAPVKILCSYIKAIHISNYKRSRNNQIGWQICMAISMELTSHFVQSSSPSLFSLHFREVVVVGDQIGHDRLVIRSRCVHICDIYKHSNTQLWQIGRPMEYWGICLLHFDSSHYSLVL